MDLAVLLISPQTVKAKQLSKVFDTIEREGFDVLDLSMLPLTPADLYEFSALVGYVPDRQMIEEFSDDSAIVAALVHPAVPATFLPAAFERRLRCRFFRAANFRPVEFWFGAQKAVE